MDESVKKEFTVNGYMFGNKTDVEIAHQELNAIKFIEKKLEGRNLDTIRSVYQAALEKKMFRTPVGYNYLSELQRRMIRMGISADDIPGIPLYQVFNNQIDEKPKPERTIIVKKKKDELALKNARLSLAVLIMAIIIIALFAISMTGSNPNILNYRNTVINEYSEWEQDLTDREAKIREKERELNITYSDSSVLEGAYESD